MKKIILLVFGFLYFPLFAQTYNADPTFNPGGTGTNGWVTGMAVQSDGKIIIVGSFTMYNDIAVNRVARLNTDGTLDSTFNVGSGPTTVDTDFPGLNTVAIDSQGKILVGGHFSSFNGSTRRCIARLNSDGSVDSTFSGSPLSSNPSLYHNVWAIDFTSDGKVIIGGSFTFSTSSGIRSAIARLNSDGTFDSSFIFQPFFFDDGADLIDISVLPNGKIYIVGDVDSATPIARLEETGSVDTTFLNDYNFGFGKKVLPVAEDKVLVGGLFQDVQNDFATRMLAKLNPDGNNAEDFTAYPALGSSSSNIVNDITLQGEKILVGGHFAVFGGENYNELVRLNSDGTVDTSFIIGTGANQPLRALSIDQNGKILIAGQFTKFNGVEKRGIVRLAEGELGISENMSRNQLLVYYKNGFYTIQSTLFEIDSIELYDSIGKKLQFVNGIDSLIAQIEGNGVRLGILKITFQNGKSQVAKLIR